VSRSAQIFVVQHFDEDLNRLLPTKLNLANQHRNHRLVA
jgi:hypothetical protein